MKGSLSGRILFGSVYAGSSAFFLFPLASLKKISTSALARALTRELSSMETEGAYACPSQ